jgi:O-antigen/teichoic acid export membrane protein
MIVSIPSSTLQTVVTKFVSAFCANKDYGKINFLLRSFVKKVSIFGLVTFSTLFFCSKSISSFLQIDSPLLIVILGIITFFSIILPLTQGGLQGLQRFGWLGIAMITNGSLKLLLGIIFVSIGFGVMGAIGALAISVFIALLLSFIILSSVLPKPLDFTGKSLQLEFNSPGTEVNFSEIYRYFYLTAIVFLCFMILTNIDVLLIKHFFKPLEAGYYSIAQMAGKIILFLPIAITLVMFPKSSELHTQSKATLHLLKKSLFYVGVMCGAACLVCFFFPDLIIRLISGERHLDCIPLVRIFSVTMLFFALVYTLLFYHLSIHSTVFIYSLVLLTVLQVILIVLFHQTLAQVLYIMCGNGILLFLINAYLAFNRRGLNATTGINSNS